MDYRIFNVRTAVNACDCARGCTDTVGESALKVDSGRQIACFNGESYLRWQRAGPMLFQLSYIPNYLAKQCYNYTHIDINLYHNAQENFVLVTDVTHGRTQTHT